MEYYPRRNRKGRPRSRTSTQQMPIHFVQRPPTCSVYNGFCSFLILASLIAVIYLMLDYHCRICSKKCDMLNITNTINDIALNISRLKESYTELEKSITKFAEEIPKIEFLETLANTMEKGDFLWNPKRDFSNVFLKEPYLTVPDQADINKNITEKIVKMVSPTY